MSFKKQIVQAARDKGIGSQPSVPPPVTVQTEASAEPEAARRRALLQAQSRRGFAASRLAGETSSGTSYQSSTGQRSLLGIA